METLLTTANRDKTKTATDTAWTYAMHDVFGLVSTLEAVAESCTRNTDATVQKQGARLSRCTQRLLKICTDATNREIDEDWLPARSVDDLVADAAQFARDHAKPETRVIVVRSVGALQPDHPDTLFRIVYNLAVNAVKAVNGAGGGTVLIDAQVIDGVLIVDVADTGTGLAASAKTVPGKTRKRPGMGLQISELLAEAIGGTLKLVKTNTSGTTLRLLYELSDFIW